MNDLQRQSDLSWSPWTWLGNQDPQKGQFRYIQQVMKGLHQASIEVKIQWSPGHAEIAGNDTADRLAKKTAKEEEDTC